MEWGGGESVKERIRQTDRQTNNEINGEKKRGMADSGNAYV